MNRRTLLVVALVAVLQLLVLGLAVAPRLSAHLLGDDYLMRVSPVDPIDPFRGAYVDLGYPGLQPDGQAGGPASEEGPVFVELVRDGDYWKAGDYSTQRPSDAPYLSCESDGWRVSCGIESWFTDQDEARRLEEELVDGAVATIKVDGRGNAAIVALEAG